MAEPTRSETKPTDQNTSPGDTGLATLVQALPIAAALFHRDGTLRLANDPARAWWIVDPQAPLSSQSWDVVLLPMGGAAVSLLASAAAGDHPGPQVMPCGSRGLRVEVRVAAVGAELLLLTALDVTPEGPRREAPRDPALELETLIGLTPSSVRIADVSGRLVRQNAHAEAEHAPEPPTTIRELWERDAPHDPARRRPLSFLESPGMRALAGGTVQREILEVRRSGGQRVVEAYAAPMHDDTGTISGVVLLDRDITDRHALETTLAEQARRTPGAGTAAMLDHEQLERLVAERSQALMASHEESLRDRRLSAVGQLAAGVMHDVNNALNPIMAAAYLLRHHAESPDAVRDYADRIQKAAETGAATASRVGRFIRQEPVHAGGDEALDLSVLADEVLDLTEPMRLKRSSASGDLHVERAFGSEVRTRGLPGEIREALLNLVQNAVDAMPAGGLLTMRTFLEGRDACVAVRDTGAGMSAEVRERAFEPFFTTKGARGSGLGLAEVYGIARRHRGTAVITSLLGQGTEVTLRFPLEVVPPPPAPVPVPGAAVPQHILVVEDHDAGRELLRRILQGAGHTVDAVGTCAEARERLAAPQGAPYDLMLTDVGLPDGSGWDLVRHSRAQAPGVRVGVITGWEPLAGSEEASGAEFVIRKPLRAVELQAHIAGRAAPASTNE